jgi:Transposase DDE domain
VWIPLAADLTPANAADNKVAPTLIGELPAETRFVLGDTRYNAPNLQEVCTQRGQLLLASRRRKYLYQGLGVEVRRVFYKLRSLAIENFGEHFKGIFDGHGQVPTKGLLNTRRFIVGAIFVYQLALLYRFENGLDLNIGLKAFLQVA